MSKDYYATLGVSKSANADEIKAAYRKLAMKFHPDRNKEAGSENKFKEISEAYAVLSDEKKRAAYDQYGSDGVNQQYGGFNPQDINFHDIFGEGSGFEDAFSQFFGQGFSGFENTRNGRSRKGESIGTEVEITLEEASTGITKTIHYEHTASCGKCGGTGSSDGRKSTCRTCHGQGVVQQVRSMGFMRFASQTTCPKCAGSGDEIDSPCTACRTSGVVEKREEIDVEIPKGVDDDTRIRLTGKGNSGFRNGHAGDLYVMIRVKANKSFERKGPNLYTESEILVTQATLGDVIKVKTLHEEVELEIPAGTQSGTTFRLKGKGIYDLSAEHTGELYVKVKVEIPTKLTTEQKELFEKLNESFGQTSKKGKKGKFKIF